MRTVTVFALADQSFLTEHCPRNYHEAFVDELVVVHARQVAGPVHAYVHDPSDLAPVSVK